MKRSISASAGFLLAVYLAAPVYAFTPIQAPILSAAAVTPNVMVLLDNSGSMNNAIQPSPVEASSFTAAQYKRGGNWQSSINDANVLLSHIDQDGCEENYRALWSSAKTSRRCYRLPDPVGSGSTRYTSKYLAYIYNTYTAAGNSGNDLRVVLPNQYRMQVARDVTTQIVTANRDLRYGLFTFNSPVKGSPGPGGSLRVEIKDFAEALNTDGSTAVTAAQAQANFEAFNTTVSAVGATANTPLAESYYEVVRYFRGESRYQGAGNGSYTSPIQYRCQKNFGIVITDGLPTYDRSFQGNDSKGNNPATPATYDLPNWDAVDNDGSNLSGDGEGDTLYLDDIAKFAFDIDSMDSTATDQAGKKFNDKQNLNTYTVGFATANQMLADAASYGSGRYYTASNSTELNDRLSQAINEISAKAGSGGAGASSSATLTSETRYYKTLYDPKDWRGTIEAYSLDPALGRIKARLWSTDSTITPVSNAASYQTFNTNSNLVVTLDYGDVSAAQQGQLDAGLASPLTGAELLSWVKGSNVTGLRERTVLLGDIINSSLERVSPTDQLASGEGYSAYLSSKSAMTSSLLVGGNDGLFHVIDAETGAHRYGYLPSTLFPSLNIVAATDYASSGVHKFMVDGLISVADAELNGAWSTLAVAGMGAGGKSLFAVKLFTGGSNAISGLWEISAPATNTPANAWNDLGYSYSKAVVARTKGNQWVAVFGNGYGSHTGKAAVYVVDLATGALVKEIVVDNNSTGTPAEIAAGTGLSSPQAVLNAQHQIEKVYAGDLRGRLWEFDFSSPDSSAWSVANAGSALFEAGVNQPITVQPLIVEQQESVEGGGHLIMFGTGKLNEVSDKMDKSLQAFYSVWDAEDNNSPVLKAELQAQSITDVKTIKGKQYFETSENLVNWKTQKGWYLPLIYEGKAEGERVIYPAQTTLGRVVFTTGKVDASDPCESSGSGRLVELDVYSGAMLAKPVLDTNGDGHVDDDDELTSGLIIDGGLPGMPVIVDEGELKDTQTKFVLLSTGEVEIVDEGGGGDTSSSLSQRILWRQLQ